MPCYPQVFAVSGCQGRQVTGRVVGDMLIYILLIALNTQLILMLCIVTRRYFHWSLELRYPKTIPYILRAQMWSCILSLNLSIPSANRRSCQPIGCVERPCKIDLSCGPCMLCHTDPLAGTSFYVLAWLPLSTTLRERRPNTMLSWGRTLAKPAQTLCRKTRHPAASTAYGKTVAIVIAAPKADASAMPPSHS